jgi:dTDP-4-dehydrorhamnose 3,5-epimerase
LSYNDKRGTLRGMHFQRPPKPEIKVVRCLRGAVYDVLLDLRPDSPTYLKHEAFELTADNRDALYVPEGIAHGFQTLTDDAEMFYQMSEFYVPTLNDGVRWNDPAFQIEWPIEDPILSDKDKAYADYTISPWAP